MMRGARRLGALARALVLLVLLVLLMAGAADAQSTGRLLFQLPPSDPLPAAFTIPARIEGFADAPRPLAVTLEIARSTDFLNVAYSSTLFGDTVAFSMVRPLPERATLFFRFRVRDARGVLIDEGIAGPRATGPRLTLLTPTGISGVTVFTEFPEFRWEAAAITIPPGPWIFDLRVAEAASGTEVIVAQDLTEPRYTSPVGLQGNTPYRWSVTARLPGGFPEDAVTVVSPATFVVRTSSAPIATLLYQNFPNPFPTAENAGTCIWFDLHVRGTVSLSIHDIRGFLVRRIVPGQLGATLPAGKYGPAPGGSGCDSRLTWDGTNDAGRDVPPGIYLVRFRANGVETYKKILFHGR